MGTAACMALQQTSAAVPAQEMKDSINLLFPVEDRREAQYAVDPESSAYWASRLSSTGKSRLMESFIS